MFPIKIDADIINKTEINDKNFDKSNLDNSDDLESESNKINKIRTKDISKVKNDNKLEKKNSHLINDKKEENKYNKNILLNIDLTPDEIKEIIDNNNPIPITRIINKIKTKYIYLYKSKNYIFYRCNKRKNCLGKAKVNITKRILQIIEYCKDNEIHEKLDYNEFYELYEKKQNNLINYKERYIQKYYVQYIIVKNKEIDNATIIKNYYDTAKEKFILSKSDISKIRT